MNTAHCSKHAEHNIQCCDCLECLLLTRAKTFHELAQSHRETAEKCDGAGLPPEYGDYERGKSDAYSVCSDTLNQWVKRASK